MYNARLVAKGFRQQEALDFSKTFSSLKEDVYMVQPCGFIDSTKPTHVCKLRMSL